jgi:redox-sensitive bicupin YhaK (pirin superfamily)
MFKVRASGERGFADFGWLQSRHTFSFGNYHDANFMGHGPLRVINEDRVASGKGFGAHSHRDMEILSWVLSGGLEHKDSIGTKAVIKPGEMQRMTAGTGITHSEYNASAKEPVHFLQIWILPDKQGLKPGYDQRQFSEDDLRDRLRLVASGDGREGSVEVHQDADVYVARMAAGATIQHAFKPNRIGWLQVARGEVSVDGQELKQGDAAALEQQATITMRASTSAEILLFDMTP